MSSYILTGNKYRDMPEEYRNSTSQEDFRSARKEENRMAGDALADTDLTQPRERSNLADASQVENIQDYDTTSFGIGSGAGGDRLSRRDLQALKSQGFSKQEIIDYSKDKVGDPTVGTKQGAKAQALLDRWAGQIAKDTPGIPTPVKDPDPDAPYDPSDPTTPPPSVQPITPPVDPTPAPVPSPPQIPINPENPNDRDPFIPPVPPTGGTSPGINANQTVSQSIFQSVNNTNNVDNSVEMNNNSTNSITGNNNQINNSQISVGGNTEISNVTDLNANNDNSQEVNAYQYGGGIWR